MNLESRHIATTPRSWCRCKYNCLKSDNCQWCEHHGNARRQAMEKLWWGHLNASHCNVPSEDQHESKTKEENIHLRNRSVANGGQKFEDFTSFLRSKALEGISIFSNLVGECCLYVWPTLSSCPKFMEKLQVLIFKNIHMYDEGPLQTFVSRTSLKSS